MNLTQPQLKALTHLELYPDEWRDDTPVAKNCLRRLWQKKLIEMQAIANPDGRDIRLAKILPAGQVGKLLQEHGLVYTPTLRRGFAVHSGST